MSPLKRILIFSSLILIVVLVVFYLTGDNSIANTQSDEAAEQVSSIQDPDSVNFTLPIYPSSSVSMDGSAANMSLMGKNFKTATYTTIDDLETVVKFYREAIGNNLSEGDVLFAGANNKILSDKKSNKSFVIINNTDGKTKIQLIDQL